MVETKMEYSKKLSSRDGINRINPLEVYVDFTENERRSDNYGKGEEWEEHVNSIQQHGVLEPIRVFWDAEKSQYHLSHGYRRMKAVLELINKGIEIKDVPVLVVKQNDQNTVLQHLILNTGRPLTDYEKSSVIIKLQNWGWPVKEIASKTGMIEQKIYNLLKFQEGASKELKEVVDEGIVSFNTGLEIARKASGNTEKQAEIIQKAKEKASETGAKKITSNIVKEVMPEEVKNGNGKGKKAKDSETEVSDKSRPTLSAVKKANSYQTKLDELEKFLMSKVDVNPDMFELFQDICLYLDANGVSKEDLYKKHFQFKDTKKKK